MQNMAQGMVRAVVNAIGQMIAQEAGLSGVLAARHGRHYAAANRSSGHRCDYRSGNAATATTTTTQVAAATTNGSSMDIRGLYGVHWLVLVLLPS